MAQRAHGELLGLHVSTADGLAGPRSENLLRHQKLLADLGGEYHEVVASDVAAALAEFARAENCTQLVLGASRRSRLDRARPRLGHQSGRAARGPDRRARDLARADRARSRRSPRGGRTSPGARRSRAAGSSSGWLLGCHRPAAADVPLGADPQTTSASRPCCCCFSRSSSPSARSAAILPGLAAAVAGFLLVNWYFTPPIHTWTISEGENVVALIVFVVVSAVVSGLVDLAARRALEGNRAHAEAETLARLAADARARTRCHALVSGLRSRVPAATRSRHVARDGYGWNVEAADGDADPARRLMRPTSSRRSAGRRARARRPDAQADDRRVLNAFASAARRRFASAPARRSEAATGIGPRPDERAARRVAASGVARPADPARVDQGGRVEPAPTRRGVESRPTSPSSSRRSRTKPIGSTRSSATCST